MRADDYMKKSKGTWPKKGAKAVLGAPAYRLPPLPHLPYLVANKMVFEVPSFMSDNLVA